MADTTISADTAERPSWRFVLRHPAHFLAFGFGVGLIPFAPGTFGTLLAYPLFLLIEPRLVAGEYLLALAALFVAGIWASQATGRHLGVADYGGIVCDEIVAFMLVLFFTPGTPVWQGAAFVLFRLFDILKPPPIRYFDRTLRGGFGVMFDDIVAAFYALLVLAVWKTATG
jgi:phosphatidylglycerophosphatase A